MRQILLQNEVGKQCTIKKVDSFCNTEHNSNVTKTVLFKKNHGNHNCNSMGVTKLKL